MSYSSPVGTLVTQPWWGEIQPIQSSKPFTQSTDIGTLRDQSLAQSKWAPKHGKPDVISTAANDVPRTNPGLTRNDNTDSDMVDAVDGANYWEQGAASKAAAKPFSLSPNAPSFKIPTSLETPTASLETRTATSDTWELDEDGDAVMTDLEGIAVIKRVADTIAVERKEARTRSSEEQSTVPGQRISNPSSLLILDTSFIISHLQIVNNLVLSHSEWRNVVVLPWTTIQELDGLKKASPKSKNDEKDRGVVDIGKLARAAIRWAHRMFAKLEPGIWGQLKEEMHDPKAPFGDASILDCCRYFKERGYRTVLLTNDQNLALTALMYSIRTVSYEFNQTAEMILEKFVGRSLSSPRMQGQQSPQGNTPERPEARWKAATFVPPQGLHATIRVVEKVSNQLAVFSNSLGDMSATGLQGSIHASNNRLGPRAHAIPIVNPSAQTPPACRPATAPSKPPSNDTKSEVGAFLKRVEKETIANLMPCIKHHIYGCLGDQSSLDYLSINPETQINTILGLENFLTKHALSVFSQHFPRGLTADLRAHRLSKLFQKWIYWAEGHGESAPTELELCDWIHDLDFLWKRLLIDLSQLRANKRGLDSWRSAVSRLGLA